MDDFLAVELVYASEAEYTLLSVLVKKGTTIREALIFSGLLSLYPEIDLDHFICGIFSQRKSVDDKVNEGDRIEVYRPLIVDPKEARRARAMFLVKR